MVFSIEAVRNLKSFGQFHSSVVERAMLAVDRKFYSQNDPYMDSPQLIGMRNIFGIQVRSWQRSYLSLDFSRLRSDDFRASYARDLFGDVARSSQTRCSHP